MCFLHFYYQQFTDFTLIAVAFIVYILLFCLFHRLKGMRDSRVKEMIIGNKFQDLGRFSHHLILNVTFRDECIIQKFLKYLLKRLKDSDHLLSYVFLQMQLHVGEMDPNIEVNLNILSQVDSLYFVQKYAYYKLSVMFYLFINPDSEQVDEFWTSMLRSRVSISSSLSCPLSVTSLTPSTTPRTRQR